MRDVLHVAKGNPRATIIADLTCADHIPADTFDCVILTQTLHLIYDMRAAVRTLHRALKRGGVLLLTAPGISQIDRGEWGSDWCWSLTAYSARRLLEETFPPAGVEVETYGNVLAAVAFLHGLAAHELRRAELDARDPCYQVLVTARAVKEGAR
jgi:SAM-dependent methyltransferase